MASDDEIVGSAVASSAPAGPAAACSRCVALLPDGKRYCPACGTAGPLALAGAESGEASSAGPSASESKPAARRTRVTLDEAMASNPIFSLLPAESRRRLAAACFRRRYRSGEWVSQEGHPGERVFLIGSGRAQTLVAAGRGRRALVRTLWPGDFFGEPVPPIDGQRVVSIQAVTALETYVFPTADVAAAAAAAPIFRTALAQHGEVAVRESFLRRASPFAPLPPDVLFELAAEMESVHYEPGELVFAEGDVGDAVYVVRQGTVDVIAGGNQVASLRLGDCFGEAALLTQQPRGASIRASESTDLLRLNREAFERILAEYEQVRGFFIELLRRRDLLTPSLELASARPGAAATAGSADATLAVSYSSTRAASLLVLVVASLLTLLARTPRGGYLLVPAVTSALLLTPATGALLLRKLGLLRESPWRRLAVLMVAGALIAVAVRRGLEDLLAMGGLAALAKAADIGVLELPGGLLSVDLAPPLAADVGLGYPLEHVGLGSLATIVSLLFLLLLAGGRRGYRLEMDGMVAGAIAGLGFGTAEVLDRWLVQLAAGPAALTATVWLDLAIAPAVATLVGALLGAGVRSARALRSPLPLLWVLFVSAVVLPPGRVDDALALPPLIAVGALALSVCVAALAVRVRLPAAVAMLGQTRAAFSLVGAVASEAGLTGRVHCRVCGTPAAAGELYCAGCGQSLVQSEA